MHRSVILVGDVTDHGGVVLTGGSARYDGKPIARVGDTVTCPTHGDNAIVGGQGSFSVDAKRMAVEGMSTACGSCLIASQTMFNILESKQDSSGRYRPSWDRTSPNQPVDNPYGASDFPDPSVGSNGLSLYPPDNIPAAPPAES